jgi:hypothetical protein
MIENLLILFAGSLSALAIYLVIAVLTSLSMENELPDLEDIEV